MKKLSMAIIWSLVTGLVAFLTFTSYALGVTKVRIGGSNVGTPVLWQFYVAQANNWFQKEDIDIEFIYTLRHVEGLAAGRLEMTVSTRGSDAIAATEAGAPIKILFSSVPNSGYTSYRLTGYPKSCPELKGKRLGVSKFGSIDEVLVKDLLPKCGLSEKDVTFIPAGDPPARHIALKAGKIDATVFGLIQAVISAGSIEGGNIISDFKFYRSGYDLVVAANEEFLKKNLEAVKKIRLISERAQKWLEDPANKAKAVEMILELRGVPKNELNIKATAANYDFWYRQPHTDLVPYKFLWEESMAEVARLEKITFKRTRFEDYVFVFPEWKDLYNKPMKEIMPWRE